MRQYYQNCTAHQRTFGRWLFITAINNDGAPCSLLLGKSLTSLCYWLFVRQLHTPLSNRVLVIQGCSWHIPNTIQQTIACAQKVRGAVGPNAVLDTEATIGTAGTILESMGFMRTAPTANANKVIQTIHLKISEHGANSG